MRRRRLCWKLGFNASNVIVYANEDTNPAFARAGIAPSRASTVGLIGSRAFDLESREVLWRYPAENVGRAIPANQSVLVVVNENRLVCLRAGRSVSNARLWSANAPVDNGMLVLRSGAVETGHFCDSGDSVWKTSEDDDMLVGSVASRDSEPIAVWPSTEIMALFDSEGRVVRSGSPALTIRALDLLDALGKSETALDLAKQAERSGSAELLRGLIEYAWDLGVDVPTSLQKKLTKLSRKKKPKLKQELAEQVRASWEELKGNPADHLWAAFTGRHESMPWSLESALLREILKRDSSFAPANEEVFARVREATAQRADTQALDWLDYLQAASVTPIRVWHHPEGKKDGEVSHAERLIARAQAQGWRRAEKDLLGFESENLLVLSSAARPGAVARCLAMGEVVCKALEELCADGENVRDDRYPLTIYLYESREEYLRESSRKLRGPREAGSGLAWTAGHFNLVEQLSRLFIPG